MPRLGFMADNLAQRLYLLFIASIAAQIPNGVGSNFSSVIIESFGFDQLEVTLLGIPSSVLQIISLTVSGWVAGRFKNSRVITMVRHPAVELWVP